MYSSYSILTTMNNSVSTVKLIDLSYICTYGNEECKSGHIYTFKVFSNVLMIVIWQSITLNTLSKMIFFFFFFLTEHHMAFGIFCRVLPKGLSVNAVEGY